MLATLAAVFDSVPAGGDTRWPDTAPSWNALLVGCDLFGALLACLTEPNEEDAILEAAALAGALSGHPSIGPQLAESGVVSAEKGHARH